MCPLHLKSEEKLNICIINIEGWELLSSNLFIEKLSFSYKSCCWYKIIRAIVLICRRRSISHARKSRTALSQHVKTRLESIRVLPSVRKPSRGRRPRTDQLPSTGGLSKSRLGVPWPKPGPLGRAIRARGSGEVGEGLFTKDKRVMRLDAQGQPDRCDCWDPALGQEICSHKTSNYLRNGLGRSLHSTQDTLRVDTASWTSVFNRGQTSNVAGHYKTRKGQLG